MIQRFGRKPSSTTSGRFSGRVARAALQSRAKIQGTSVYATDLIAEIMECLGNAERKEHRTFDGASSPAFSERQ